MSRGFGRILMSAAVLVLLLAGCGSSGTTQQGGTGAQAPTGTPAPTTAPASTNTPGMDHGMMATSTPGMDHGGMPMGDAPFDAMFIDSMIEHHQGAIDMAEQALAEAEHQELKDLATAIITAQEGEIKQMTAWRAQWYPDLAKTEGMGMHMGDMTISTDTSHPFDLRFIDAMISHHQGAIMMAKEAQKQAEHAEIKQLAGEIIAAQEAEIKQMEEWKTAWSSGH